MSDLLHKLLQQREVSVEVEPGKHLRLRRPAVARLHRFRSGITPELLAEHCVGWSGVTEADILGTAFAPPEPAEFDAGLVTELLADREQWFEAAAAAMTKAIVDRMAQVETTAKN
jgi:hypothetical protein